MTDPRSRAILAALLTGALAPAAGCYASAGFGGGGPVGDDRPGGGLHVRFNPGFYYEAERYRVGGGPDAALVNADGGEDSDFTTIMYGASARADLKMGPLGAGWNWSTGARVFVGDATSISTPNTPDRTFATSFLAGVSLERPHDRQLYGAFTLAASATMVGLDGEDPVWFLGAMLLGEITIDIEHLRRRRD